MRRTLNRLLPVLTAVLGLAVLAPAIAAAETVEGPLNVNGDINTNGVYRINGVVVCTSSGCMSNAGASNYIQNGTITQLGNFNLQSASPGSPTAVLQAAAGQSAPLFAALAPGGFEVFSISPFGRVVANGSLESRGPFFADNGMQAFNSVAIQPPFGDSNALDVESPSPANIVVFEVNTEKDVVELRAHLQTGNATGTTSVAAGGGAGSGASASLSGDDTVGTVTATTGSGPSAGNLAVVTFSSAYGASPHVVISPGSSAAATAKYYTTNVTASGFTIAVAGSKPKANTSYTYNYSVSQ